jgi:hypoxanthine-DNA glycosylase
MGFYYGHPQNVFWATLARILRAEEPPRDVATRKEFLLSYRIALWDVLHACDIEGASDASITKPIPNLFGPILQRSEICAIFTTGRAATELFNRLCAEEAGMLARYLPSTSPANRAAQAKPLFLQQWAQVATALK